MLVSDSLSKNDHLQMLPCIGKLWYFQIGDLKILGSVIQEVKKVSPIEKHICSFKNRSVRSRNMYPVEQQKMQSIANLLVFSYCLHNLQTLYAQ